MGCTPSKKDTSPRNSKPKKIPLNFHPSVAILSSTHEPEDKIGPTNNQSLTPVSIHEDIKPSEITQTTKDQISGYFHLPFSLPSTHHPTTTPFNPFKHHNPDKKLTKLLSTNPNTTTKLLQQLQSHSTTSPPSSIRTLIQRQNTPFLKLFLIYHHLKQSYQSSNPMPSCGQMADEMARLCLQARVECDVIGCYRRGLYCKGVDDRWVVNWVDVGGRRCFVDLRLDVDGGLGGRAWVMTGEEVLVDHYLEGDFFGVVVQGATLEQFLKTPVVGVEFFRHDVVLRSYDKFEICVGDDYKIDFRFEFRYGAGNYVNDVVEPDGHGTLLKVAVTYVDALDKKHLETHQGFLLREDEGNYLARVLFKREEEVGVDTFITVFSGTSPLFQYSVSGYRQAPPYFCLPTLIPNIGQSEIPSLIMPNCGPLWTDSVVRVKIKRSIFTSMRIRQGIDKDGKYSNDIVLHPCGEYFQGDVYVCYKEFIIIALLHEEEQPIYSLPIRDPNRKENHGEIPNLVSVDDLDQPIKPKYLEFPHGVQAVSHLNPIVDMNGSCTLDLDFSLPKDLTCIPMLTSNFRRRKLPENVLLQRDSDTPLESRISILLANQSVHVLTLLAKKKTGADRYEEVFKYVFYNGAPSPRHFSLPQISNLEATSLVAPLQGTLTEDSLVSFELKTPIRWDWVVQQGGREEKMRVTGKYRTLNTTIGTGLNVVSVGYHYGSGEFKCFAQYKIRKRT
mmetsp:Transcript_4108/g.4540  ORF Transcript_4108/g.4540 Transcript_4108/m.4540 type:complete len:727 (+) Transcript_4108:30-2210(+)